MGTQELTTGTQGTRMNTQELIAESQKWLDIISAKELSQEQRNKIEHDTVDNFSFYYNRGYLEYRKSVIEMRESPALEWAGEGSTFQDLAGRTYIDCLGGYGIYSAGIRHPKILKAVADQLQRMPLSSQELLDPLRGALAELLGEITPGDLQYSFFINNGTDAVEGAIKLARVFTGRTNFISSIRGFHGKSCGSLSLLGKWEYREPFLPLLPGIHFVEFGDADAVIEELYKADATGKGIAGVIMEPIQGEAGAIVPPDDFWPRIRKACDEYGALLIADEVQTGLGRTGKLFGVDHWDVVPDIMCLGKAIGGGVMPLSAFISTPKIWSVLETNPFIHSSTFGGNPLACAAGIAAINVTLEEDLPGQAARKGKYLLAQLIRLRDALRPAPPARRRQGPSARHGVRQHGDRLQGRLGTLPPRHPGGRHPDQLQGRPHRARAQHPGQADQRGARRPRGDAQGSRRRHAGHQGRRGLTRR